jgi:flagellar secretion chaperone FliS
MTYNSRNDRLKAYKETSVKTANPGRLIVMLYDEALKQIDHAVELLNGKSKKYDVVNNAILKAQDIVAELMVSLNFDKGGDVAKNLFNLYMFFNSKLMDGNVNKNPEPLMEVRENMAELKEAWEALEQKNTVNGEGKSKLGVNIAG